MRHISSLLIFFLICCSFLECKKDDNNTIEPTIEKALIIKPAKSTKTESGISTKDGSVVYAIDSVFWGGSIVNPDEGSSHRCHFFQKKANESPNLNKEKALIEIWGFKYSNRTYTEPGQYIDQIIINGLDESLGFGSCLNIPMDQGKYNGGNDLIKSVQIKSYKFASYIDNDGHQNKDSDINIVITSKASDIITIRFANDITPHDGIY